MSQLISTGKTEIIRSILMEDLDSTAKRLIHGVQHHIYTVLNITVYAHSVAADRNWVKCYLQAYDSLAGDSQAIIQIFRQDMSAFETFVWNDKWSFNGGEPTDFAGPMDSAAKQDAIADQADGTAQNLIIETEGADAMDITCTYIDQNNS